MSAKIAEIVFSRRVSSAVLRMDFSRASTFWLFVSAILVRSSGKLIPMILTDPQLGNCTGKRASSVRVDSNESYAKRAKTSAVTNQIRQKAPCVHFGMEISAYLTVFLGAFLTGALCGVGGVLSILRSTPSGSSGRDLGFCCFMAGV
jgi:hypothetical protein